MKYFHSCRTISICVVLTCWGWSMAVEPEKIQPGRLIPALGKGQTNLVPNASFECGKDGWGSSELNLLPGWYSSLDGLFGVLDSTTAAHGRVSLKIEITPENQPVAFTDYLHTQRQRITGPMAANLGWIAVTPGQKYTYSVAMKAAKDGTPARLVVRQFRAAPIEKPVRLTTEWQRYSMEFTPEAEACYVLAGPELRSNGDNPQPPDRATVWVDAVQLRPGEAKALFTTRQPVEFGVETDKPGNIFTWDEPLSFRVRVASTDEKQERKADITLRLTDYFDKEVWHKSIAVDLPASAAKEEAVVVPASPQCRGYLQLEARMTSGTIDETRKMRLAATPVYTLADSRFGLNHAFGWPEQLELIRRAGMLWIRDWSAKWQDVEPEKGRFTFVETDAEMDRLFRQNLNVLAILAFPSTMWSSSAPPDIQPPDPWYYILTDSPDRERQIDDIQVEFGMPHARMGYAPRDPVDLEKYVTRTVTHYKDRIHDWHLFNEPLETPYSFYAPHGYKMADYLRYREVAAEAARRADPQCRLLGGFIIGDPKGTAQRLEEFISLGGMKLVDVLTYHTYPGDMPPEFVDDVLKELNAVMDRHGVRKPIWFTEFAYFADDDPWCKPWKRWATMVASERVQAEYHVRMSTLLFANGVEKLFHHAGVGVGINYTAFWTVMLRYGNEPYRCYASQAFMSQLFTPTCKFVKRLAADQPVRAYLFADAKRTLAAIWSPEKTEARPAQLADPRLQLVDIMGRPQDGRTFTPSESPMYVIGEGVSAEEFEKGLSLAP